MASVLMEEEKKNAEEKQQQEEEEEQEEQEEQEESELERKERAYLSRLSFTSQHAHDSVAEMHRLLVASAGEEGAGPYGKQLDALASIIKGDTSRETLFSTMISVQKVISSVRRQVLQGIPQSEALVQVENAPQPGEDPQHLRENKFRYLIGQHARKDKALKQSVWDTYVAVAKRVFDMDIQKAEDFLTDDRAIAVYIVAKRKTDLAMGSMEMLDNIMQSFELEDFNDIGKRQEIGDRFFAPLLFEKEWEQLELEEGIQKELQKERKEREEKEETETETETEEEKEIKLATREGFINYKFIVAESMFRGRMRTVEPQE